MGQVVGAELCERLEWNPQAGPAARAIVPILEHEAAPMRFSNLPAQHETDAGSAGFRGEE